MIMRERAPTLQDFGDLFLPTEADEPILARAVRNALTEWLTEIWAEKELLAVGVRPRRRAIFDGAPGVGKTTLAHHLAARLGLTMVAVRPDNIIDKFVGSSGRNIGGLFEAAKREGPVLLFLDEFDSIAPKRGRREQAADDSRNEMVNTLLQRLEQHDGYVIAATNYGQQIDPAIWRRFDLQITLDLPGQGERERILSRYLAPYTLPAEALAGLAGAFNAASPALMRAFCENLKRQLVVGPKLNADMAVGAVFDRILASCHPHKDAGLPRLWTVGSADRAVSGLPWPLPLDGARP